MTQVVTVSPSTAAYASEAYKQRNARHTPMETAISEWHARAIESGDAYDRGLLNVVQPPSLQLAFLTAEPRQYRTVTVEEAIAEYATFDGSNASVGETENAPAEAAPEPVAEIETAPAPESAETPVYVAVAE